MQLGRDTVRDDVPVKSKRATGASFLAISDLVVLLLVGLSMVAAGRIVDNVDAIQPRVTLVFVVAVIWSLSLWAVDAYSPYYWPSGIDFYLLPLRSVVPFAGLTAIVFVVSNVELHRRYALTFVVLGTVMLLFVRAVFRSILLFSLRRGRLGEPTLVLLEKEDDWAAISRVLDGAGGAFRVIGAVGSSRDVADAAGINYLGKEDRLSNPNLVGAAGLVIANGATVPPKQLDRLAWMVSGSDIHLTVVVDPRLVSSPRLRFRSAFGVIVGEAGIPGLSPLQRALKRTFDVIAASVALLLAAPVFLLVAAAIYIEDRGPIFFRQDRVGAGMSLFSIFKFRSMFVGADRMEKKLREQHHRPGQMWKLDQDPRITRVGNVLRKTSLDEIPQLLNVLKGDMSLVGPRPKQPWEMDSYTEEQLRRFSLVPGVTGLSQVSGRSDLSLDEAVELDLEYARNWSLGRDIVICVRTALQLATRRGAY